MTATAPGTGSAGTYYFLDRLIDSEGRKYNGVRSGLAVTASGTLTLNVSAGVFHAIAITEPFRSYAGGTVTISTPHTEFTRVDVISIYWDGEAGPPQAVLSVTPGPALENGNPQPIEGPPLDPGGNLSIVLATVVVYPGVTAIQSYDIFDRRFPLAFEFTGKSGITATGVLPVAANQLAMWTTDGDLAVAGLVSTAVVSGPAASVADEVVLFDGTTGKLIKRASATGRPKLTAGVQSVAAIDLASEVTGDLPYANLVPATAASRLLLRGAASGAGDWQEGTVGSGLSLSGTVLSATGGAGSGPTMVRLTSNATANATTTGVEITGLKKASTGTGTFIVKYVIRYQSSATGNGIKFGVNHTGTTPVFMFNTTIQVAGGSANAASQATASPANPGGMSTRTKSTTAPNLGPTTSVDAANTDMMWFIDGLIQVTSDGDLELWSGSEAAVSVQVMAESCLLLQPVA